MRTSNWQYIKIIVMMTMTVEREKLRVCCAATVCLTTGKPRMPNTKRHFGEQGSKFCMRSNQKRQNNMIPNVGATQKGTAVTFRGEGTSYKH
jgi:hypothetical protein